tara:strand:- start:5543 stop:5902 length:360 start_codon:yes stop_codon:yes gene_type:complete
MKALIFENKVVDLCETEFPVSPEMEWVDCDDTVKTNYEYKDGTFTKPPFTQPPEQFLRKIRNQMLSQSDWEMLKGLETGADMSALKQYRQELRDLPANSTPKLDDNGVLTKVTWPTKPE